MELHVMSKALILYFSRGGHTAQISKVIKEELEQNKHTCDVFNINSDLIHQIKWDTYDVVAFGSCVLYGSYHKSVFQFLNEHHDKLAKIPNSFFCVNVVARNPEKRIPENNKYLQKFIKLSPWQPKDLKIIAGKVDYPSWPWYDSLMIRLIMKMTNGPTDPKAVIDFTDWDDVKAYARHLANLND